MNPFLESSAEPKERACFVIDRVYRALVSSYISFQDNDSYNWLLSVIVFLKEGHALLRM